MAPGAATEDANAVGIDAVLPRMLADEADRAPHVRHDRRQGIPRPAAVSHGEDGESLLVQRRIGLGENLGELHARLPPAAHDGDEASAVGVCRAVHIERERQAVLLVPVDHIRRHRGLTRGWLGADDARRR